MFKKICLTLFFVLGICHFSNVKPALAEEEVVLEETTGTGTEIIVPEIEPVISSEDFILVNKKSLFDAADSVLLLDASEAQYYWNFGDGSPEQIGKEIVHDFPNTGSYFVNLKIRQGDHEKNIQKKVFVYNKKAILITDEGQFVKEEKGTDVQFNMAIEDQAARQGIWLTVITITTEETNFLGEEKIVQKITQKADLFKESDYLIFYSKSSLGLQAFSRYLKNLSEEEKIDLSQKLLVKITDENLDISAKITQPIFNLIKPSFILVTRKEAINPIFELKNKNEIIKELSSRAIEYSIVDERSERSKVFVLSSILSGFIAQGIPSNAIYLILAFPFAAFFIAFSRQVIGLSTFGVYTPLMLIISFLILGINLGLTVFFVVIAISYILRRIFNQIELLYIPRVSLIFSFISLSFLITIWVVLKFSSPGVITLSIFPMLVMSTMSEKFVSAQSEEGIRNALFSAFETVIIAIFSYYFLIWTNFVDLLMSMPELILLPLIGNFLLGKFSGLRLTEYFRFRMLLKENMEE